jgi:hypothetical protein
MQLFDLSITQGLCQRDAFHIGADARGNWRDIYRFIAHGMTFQ